MAGYKAAMKRAGLTVRPGMTPLARAVTIEEGARAAAELLREHPDVTAIFAGNDLLALGCYDALAAAGRRCPEDVSVIGFNDMPFADRLNPPLTTLHFDDYGMGNAAAQLLLHQLRSGAVPWNASHLELATSLVVRGSTAPASRGAGRRRAA
jgi:LacI family transcriptional regulator